MAEADEGAATGAGPGHAHAPDPVSPEAAAHPSTPGETVSGEPALDASQAGAGEGPEALHESPTPEVAAPEPASSEPTPPEPTAEDPTPPEPLTVASSPVASPATEWTASDARGPLIEADATRAHAEAMQAAEAHDEPAAPTAAAASAPPHDTGYAASPDPLMVAAAPRLSAWPIAASLVAGALIGAVVALLVYRTQVRGAEAGPQVADLSAKVAALEAKSNAPDADKAALTDLQSQLAAVQGKVAGLSKTAPSGSAQPAFDPGPLEQKITALTATVDSLEKQGSGAADAMSKVADLDGKVSALASTVGDLQKQTAATANGLQAMQSSQKGLEAKVSAPALAIVADSLVQQIDDGRPFAAQLDALASLGADPAKLAVLKPNAATGVASAKALAAKFAPLTDSILATERKAPPGASFLTRLETGLLNLVSIRRADDTSGSDLASRVARLQADLDHDDVGDAVATWTALPADARAKSEAWGTLAKTSADTRAAAHDLQSEAIAAMGGRKS